MLQNLCTTQENPTKKLCGQLTIELCSRVINELFNFVKMDLCRGLIIIKLLKCVKMEL